MISTAFQLILLSLALVLGQVAQSAPDDLQCEYMTDPIGLDTTAPRFSWKQANPEKIRGQKQSSWHILVASSREMLDRNQGDLWDSGKIDSNQSHLVAYSGKPLVSNQACHWKVRIHDKDNVESEWSKPATFSIGLLSGSDWKGPWIRHPDADPKKHIWFRKNLNLDSKLKSALIHVACVGYHELYVNGVRVGDLALGAALTRLDKRVLYLTYDLSKILKPGENTIAIWQGPGWARYAFYKTRPALRVQLDGVTETGKVVTLSSDQTWRCRVSSSENIGGTQYSDNGGERMDARAFLADWNAVGFDDSQWPTAVETPVKAQLSAQNMEPTRIIETIPAKSIELKGKSYRVDMGKNFTGWVEIKLKGLAAGDLVVLKVADGDDTVQDFGQKSEFISAGKDGEIFRNRFNYLAGRYITLEGLKKRPEASDIKGFALGTDLEMTGSFVSSNDLFNRIYQADLWTWRANLVEGFTMDCPHRERLGYGEVAFACAWGLAFPNYQAGALYTKHVRDWSDVQEKNGWIHNTAPQINQHFGGPMWSSAGLNIAREFYRNHGDRRVLELTYSSSKKWLEFLNSNVKGGLLRNYDKHWGKFLGDWAAPEQRKERGDSPEAEFFNNCVYVMNLADFIEIARILGKQDDVRLYTERLDELRKQTHARYFNAKENTYCNGTHVQLAFALLTQVTPEALRPEVEKKLAAELVGKSYLDMGSSGLPVLLKYLIEESSSAGLLYSHLSRTDEPSYGYFIKRGESTWPEYWNVDVPSRIHTCYTGISSWFTKTVAGIQLDPQHPGLQSILIKPTPGGDLAFAEATMESPYGKISSRWEKKKDVLRLLITVPANSKAILYLPTSQAAGITEGGMPLKSVAGVTPLRVVDQRAVLELESGSYDFLSRVN